MQGVATREERNFYFQLSKRGQGFTPEERRQVWLQVTGAQGLLDASYLQKNADYVTLLDQLDLDFPTQNKHQIAVDMGRTFPDEAFF